MTEPPEPRDPEEGGGEDAPDWDGMERDAVRDFVADSTPDMQEAIDQARAEMGDEAFDAAVAEVLRRVNERDNEEALEELDDDMLLDALGRGEDEAGELGDMLGNWRDDVESEPVGPIAENAQEIHELNQQYDRPAERPTPRAPETGGQSNMINEGAQILTGIAQSGEVQGAIQSAGEGIRSAAAALQQAIQTLTEQGATAANAAGGSEGEQLNGAAQSAVAALETALSQVAMFDTDEVVGQVGVFYNAVSDAAAKHSS